VKILKHILLSLSLNDLKFSNPEEKNNVLISTTFENALEILNNRYSHIVEKMVAVGGTSVYQMSLSSSCFKRLYLTRVFGSFECDVFLEPAEFLNGLIKVDSTSLGREIQDYGCEYNVMKRDPVNGIEYIFEVYQKA